MENLQGVYYCCLCQVQWPTCQVCSITRRSHPQIFRCLKASSLWWLNKFWSYAKQNYPLSPSFIFLVDCRSTWMTERLVAALSCSLYQTNNLSLFSFQTCNLCLSGTAGPSAFVSPLRIFSDGEDFVPESFIEGTDREPTVFPSEVTLKKQSKRQGSKPLHKSKKKSKKRKKKNKLVVPESLDPAEESGKNPAYFP